MAVPVEPFHVHVADDAVAAADHAGHRGSFDIGRYSYGSDPFRVLHLIGMVAGQGGGTY